MSHAENITAGAPAPSLSKSEVSRWNILDAAAATFRRKGYAATRLTDIAAAANDLRSKGVEVDDPNLVPATGRTIINGRDPDGWRMQFVDAKRDEPTE